MNRYNKVYWVGYRHGAQGLSRLNTYEGDMEIAYTDGYDDGKHVPETTKSNEAQVTQPNSLTTSQVMSMRNEINKHKEAIKLLEDKINANEG